jgi:hypothetical protein
MAIYGQSNNERYWLRLDPTPGGGGVEGTEGGGVRQVFDLAQNIWDDYVVDMDSKRQQKAVLGTPGLTPMSDSYSRLISVLTEKLAQIRAGELGGGSLASRQSFSWPAAVIGVVMTLVFVVLLRLRAPTWIRKRIGHRMGMDVERPEVEFYAQTLDQLARVGVNRRAEQTPVELAEHAQQRLTHPRMPSISGPLGVLTSAFYKVRFGGADHVNGSERTSRKPEDRDVDAALAQLTRSVDMIENSTKMRNSGS